MDELEAERRRLLAEHSELLAAHAVLRKHRHDRAGHHVHAARLREHMTQLHAFHERLRTPKPQF